jgi:hypothetical protein
MYVSAIRIEGLRDADGFELSDLGSVVTLPAGPQGGAVADALVLVGATLQAAQTRAAVTALGFAGPWDVEVWEEDGLPVQVVWKDAGAVHPWLAEHTRQVTIDVELALDPPMFGRLRELAVRDPRLVSGLADQGITLKLGWLLTSDLTAAAPSVLSVAIGSVRFSAVGSDRPPWLVELVALVAKKIARVPWEGSTEELAARLHDASTSPLTEVRAAWRRLATAMGAPPFGFGEAQLVSSGRSNTPVAVAFGPELRRARAFGPSAQHALHLAEAVLLNAPDVLVVDDPGGDLREWLIAHTTGDEATLEQVWLIPGGAG